ncbi:hypothetical protein BV25DRAFT_1236738 [Artomyces pyxidatus]|uniref:Uncharacterized protein n=1 Tax=Artomyces pyxidatus TaxID=48021 RepID=A0ACB8SRA0_9AGAM|nr:hypothetical protein BV25DRAFT_1236738 [Artomyces pyxidatus]
MIWSLRQVCHSAIDEIREAPPSEMGDGDTISFAPVKTDRLIHQKLQSRRADLPLSTSMIHVAPRKLRPKAKREPRVPNWMEFPRCPLTPYTCADYVTDLRWNPPTEGGPHICIQRCVSGFQLDVSDLSGSSPIVGLWFSDVACDMPDCSVTGSFPWKAGWASDYHPSTYIGLLSVV